jgi:hypothetical protein
MTRPKFKLPHVLVDGDGDVWHLQPSGLYKMTPGYGSERSFEYVGREWGIGRETFE